MTRDELPVSTSSFVLDSQETYKDVLWSATAFSTVNNAATRRHSSSQQNRFALKKWRMPNSRDILVM